MVDQTVEIKLILRDELSKQLGPINAQLRELQTSVNLQRPSEEMGRFARLTGMVARELNTLANITFAYWIGGGVVNSIVSISQALKEMTREGLQLHYTADALGTTTTMLNQFSDAMTALGKSRQEGLAATQAATKALRELQIEGEGSSLFKQMEETGGESGKRLARALATEIAGPRGLQGGLELAMRRMAAMSPESAAKFGELIGVQGGKKFAQDWIDALGKLPQRIELPIQKMKELQLANASMDVSLDNIKTSLATVLLPIFADLSQAIDRFLQSEGGQKFLERMRAWGQDLTDAIDKWMKTGGLDKAVSELRQSLKELSDGFSAADVLLQQMGVSWPEVIGGLMLTKFAADLGAIALALRAVWTAGSFLLANPAAAAALGGAAAALLAIMQQRAKTPEELEQQKKEQRPFDKRLQELLEGGWGGLKWLYDRSIWGDVRPEKQGYEEEGLPKSDQERRADLAEKKSAEQGLIDEVRETNYALAKLNSFAMVGGPEGGKGPSGFQNLIGYMEPTVQQIVTGLSRLGEGSGTSLKTLRMSEFPMSRPSPALVDEKWSRLPSYPSEMIESRLPVSSYLGRSLTSPSFKMPHVDPSMNLSALFGSARSRGRGVSVADLLGGRGPRRDAYVPIEPTSRMAVEAGIDDVGSGITSFIADRSSRLSGSATVDIDVSGLGDSKRRPSDLFKPQAVRGVVQMANNTRPEDNPLSFE